MGKKKRKPPAQDMVPDLIIIDDPPNLRPRTEEEQVRIMRWYKEVYLQRRK